MLIQGKVVNVINRDVMVARFSQGIPRGTKIVDNRKQQLGTALSLMGPLDNPFVEIRVKGNQLNPISMMEKSVYAEVE